MSAGGGEKHNPDNLFRSFSLCLIKLGIHFTKAHLSLQMLIKLQSFWVTDSSIYESKLSGVSCQTAITMMYWHMLRIVNSTHRQRHRTSSANGVCQSFCQFCPLCRLLQPPCMPQMFFLVTPTDRNLLAEKKKALLSLRSGVQSLVCTQQMQKQVHLLVAPFATWTWRDWRVRLVWLGLYTQCWMRSERASCLWTQEKRV